jgi:hypothetical protein
MLFLGFFRWGIFFWWIFHLMIFRGLTLEPSFRFTPCHAHQISPKIVWEWLRMYMIHEIWMYFKRAGSMNAVRNNFSFTMSRYVFFSSLNDFSRIWFHWNFLILWVSWELGLIMNQFDYFLHYLVSCSLFCLVMSGMRDFRALDRFLGNDWSFFNGFFLNFP